MNPLRTPSFSQLVNGIDRVDLGVRETPVQRLEIPGFESRDQLWVKREDLVAEVYGGNKARKLEFLLAKGSGPVITCGGIGSHHVLATALHAESLGRSCVGVLVPQPETDHTRRILSLNRRFCRAVVRVDRPVDSAPGLLAFAPDGLGYVATSGLPTVIPPGGSNAIGTLGYVGAGLELAAQVERGECPRPDSIYLPLGSGGTAAGLALGLGLAGLDSEVVAVRVATILTGNRSYLSFLARRTHSLLSARGDIGPMPTLNLRVVHRFVGDGYGYETVGGMEALEAGRKSGMELEPTYSGKALAALLFEARERRGGGSRVRMFLDTFGPLDNLELLQEKST